ncbi:MAG: hypothetical protein HWE08_09290 [Alphaproteobacteria bacterium]|nr:hypothetical protein [Alphaproteobacteria bacterium]
MADQVKAVPIKTKDIKMRKGFWQPKTIDIIFVLTSMSVLAASIGFATPVASAFEAFRNAIPILAICVALYPNLRRDAQEAVEKKLEKTLKFRDRTEHMIRLQLTMSAELKHCIDTVKSWLEKPHEEYATMVITLPGRPICKACVNRIDELPLGLMNAIGSNEGTLQIYEATIAKHPFEKVYDVQSIHKLLGELLNVLEIYRNALEKADVGELPTITFDGN